ncbi:hypothetical protein BsWGS_13807 [Bradybaena similaris]
MKPRLAASATLTSPVDPSKEPRIYQGQELLEDFDDELASRISEELDKNHIKRGSIKHLKPTPLSPPPSRPLWARLCRKFWLLLLLTTVIIIIVFIFIYLLTEL